MLSFVVGNQITCVCFRYSDRFLLFQEVRSLAFHPREQILASGGVDCTLKFFDYSKVSAKRASKSIQEVEPVRALSFHPTGDFLLVGTNHPVGKISLNFSFCFFLIKKKFLVRLYDVNTLQCYVSPNPKDQHRGPITDVSENDPKFSSGLKVGGGRGGGATVWGLISFCEKFSVMD